MIERFYVKNHLSFKEAELQFDKGLVVFTGASGSGKSILMNAILTSLGLGDADANICESSVGWPLDEEACGIENEECNVFRHVKKEKVRFFVNNQSISKKAIQGLSSDYLRHLSLKDYSDFDNEKLLDLLDYAIISKNSKFQVTLDSYKESYAQFIALEKELEKLNEEQQRIVELKEFARFEIAKIEAIAPEANEDEALLEIKKELSRKEKAQEKIVEAQLIFEKEYAVTQALDALDIDSAFFDDTMNVLRNELDSALTRLEELDDIDVEEILDRIEALSGLKHRYGSLEEAIAYKETKIEELRAYDNIEIRKDDIEKEVALLRDEVTQLAHEITKKRYDVIPSLTKNVNTYLKQLYMNQAHIVLNTTSFNARGQEEVSISLDGTPLEKISSGEFNRLRLALLALKTEYMPHVNGVLMLDEIDANLSGEESMSVAKVLRHLSKVFQIFVISHQPQLTSMGEQHFLVYRDDESRVRVLKEEERVDEIARMISGDKISKEAKTFAKELLQSAQCVS